MSIDKFPPLEPLIFKIMASKRFDFIPWPMIAPHEEQAHRNHGQTLRRLNERGGLSTCEVVAVIEGRRWRPMTDKDAEARLDELLNDYTKSAERSR